MDSKDFNITQLGPATIDSPLTGIKFIPNDSKVAFDTDAETLADYVRQGKANPAFEKAGPREKLFHDPAWSKAAILTAGGLCPGLNDVIKFLVSTLYRQFKVQQIYGIRYGYRGLNPVHHLSPILLPMIIPMPSTKRAERSSPPAAEKRIPLSSWIRWCA